MVTSISGPNEGNAIGSVGVSAILFEQEMINTAVNTILKKFFPLIISVFNPS